MHPIKRPVDNRARAGQYPISRIGSTSRQRTVYSGANGRYRRLVPVGSAPIDGASMATVAPANPTKDCPRKRRRSIRFAFPFPGTPVREEKRLSQSTLVSYGHNTARLLSRQRVDASLELRVSIHGCQTELDRPLFSNQTVSTRSDRNPGVRSHVDEPTCLVVVYVVLSARLGWLALGFQVGGEVIGGAIRGVGLE